MRKLGIVVTATVIGVILLASGCGSSGAAATPAKPSTSPTSPARAEVATLLGGIPQRGRTLGDSTVPVTLEYFGDLQCPFCRRFTLGALPTLIRRYVRAGTLMIDYRSLESATRVPSTFRAQQTAALAAGGQDRLWNFIELFYHEQGREDSGYVNRTLPAGPGAAGARAEPAHLERGARQHRTRQGDLEGRRLGAGIGFRGTPGFLFANGAGSLRVFRPRTLTDVKPYAFAVKQMLRLDHRRRPGGGLLPSSQPCETVRRCAWNTPSHD